MVDSFDKFANIASVMLGAVILYQGYMFKQENKLKRNKHDELSRKINAKTEEASQALNRA